LYNLESDAVQEALGLNLTQKEDCVHPTNKKTKKKKASAGLAHLTRLKSSPSSPKLEMEWEEKEEEW